MAPILLLLLAEGIFRFLISQRHGVFDSEKCLVSFISIGQNLLSIGLFFFLWPSPDSINDDGDELMMITLAGLYSHPSLLSGSSSPPQV